MFNLGFSELILLGIIALIFIGPHQLPEVARSIGRLLNELKRATNDFQSTITSPIKDEIQSRIHDVRSNLSVPPEEAAPAEAIEQAPDLPVGVVPVTKKDDKV